MDIRNAITIVEASADKYAVEKYEALGISAEDAAKFIKYKLEPVDAAFYIKLGKGVPGALDRIEQERLRYVIRRAKERAQDKLISKLPEVAARGGPVSYQTGCALIAYDEELFDTILTYVAADVDVFEDRPEIAKRMVSILRRMAPTSRTLYRGQAAHNNDHTRGFHSWSGARDTAADFGSGGRLFTIHGPFQGASLSDILTWRSWMTGEGHMHGSQAEWFVLDDPSFFKNGERP
jgi:hypothetical protein